MDDNGNDIHPIAKLLTYIIAGAFGLFGLWCTVIAFVGGTIPIIGWELSGGLLSGLLWLFIADPILMTVGYWVGMIVVIPVHLLISWLGE